MLQDASGNNRDRIILLKTSAVIFYMKCAQNKDFNILHHLYTELSIQMEDLSVLLKRALLYFDKNKYLLTHFLQT